MEHIQRKDGASVTPTMLHLDVPGESNASTYTDAKCARSLITACRNVVRTLTKEKEEREIKAKEGHDYPHILCQGLHLPPLLILLPVHRTFQVVPLLFIWGWQRQMARCHNHHPRPPPYPHPPPSPPLSLKNELTCSNCIHLFTAHSFILLLRRALQ